MRIAITSWTKRAVGGTETYLKQIIWQLYRYGHSAAFWVEVDKPQDRPLIDLPVGIPVWCASEMGSNSAVSALASWQPDLIYANGLLNASLDSQVLSLAPSIFFAHNYYGTCISGSKTFKWPVETPCMRTFGWQCLLQYYPRRCGGWNPLSMLNNYQLQSQRLQLLKRYWAILTLSEHMRLEYLRHGFSADRVFNISHGLSSGGMEPISLEPTLCETRNPNRDGKAPWKLLFIGRMDHLKGGHILLKALPQVSKTLGTTLEVTFAGDGPARQNWVKQATGLQAAHGGIQITFVGWLSEAQTTQVFSNSDLLVLPSLWPEPFGRVGSEAGSHGVPVAAFDVGGIREWLMDGVNGLLAPGNPPSANGLALTIIRCLHDRLQYDRLCRGALALAQQFNSDRYAKATLEVFERVLKASPC